MALRLKYASVPADKIKIIPEINKAVEYVGQTAQNEITIMPTYTALLYVNKLKSLKK